MSKEACRYVKPEDKPSGPFCCGAPFVSDSLFLIAPDQQHILIGEATRCGRCGRVQVFRLNDNAAGMKLCPSDVKAMLNKSSRRAFARKEYEDAGK